MHAPVIINGAVYSSFASCCSGYRPRLHHHPSSSRSGTRRSFSSSLLPSSGSFSSVFISSGAGFRRRAVGRSSAARSLSSAAAAAAAAAAPGRGGGARAGLLSIAPPPPSDPSRSSVIGTGGGGFTTATTATVGGHHAVRLRLPHQPGGGGRGLFSRGNSNSTLSTRAKAAGPPGGVDGAGEQGSSINGSSATQDPPLTPGGIKSVDHPKLEKPGFGTMREVIPLPVARGLLLMVPVLWATYNPALRYIYESTAPPTPAELTAVRMLISLVPFAPILLTIGRDASVVSSGSSGGGGEDGLSSLGGGLVGGGGGGGSSRGSDAAGAGAARGGAVGGGGSSGRTRDAKHIQLLVRAGIELGLLNWAGTAAQAWGLEQTSSTRAGFLLSTINAMVPVGTALQGHRVPPATWAACALALAGVIIISEIHVPMVHLPGFGGKIAAGGGGISGGLGAVGGGTMPDGVAAEMVSSSSSASAAATALSDAMGGALTDAGMTVGTSGMDLNRGDAVVLTAAVLYSAFTIRLGTYARELNAADLSAVKSLVMAVLCVMWVLLEQAYYISGGGGGIEVRRVFVIWLYMYCYRYCIFYFVLLAHTVFFFFSPS